MRWDAATDKYVPIEWADAFAAIGAELKSLTPESVVFYTSGRASLEASYMYQLLARMYGNNNLPRQLEHVSREHVSGAAADDWCAGWHREAR